MRTFRMLSLAVLAVPSLAWAQAAPAAELAPPPSEVVTPPPEPAAPPEPIAPPGPIAPPAAAEMAPPPQPAERQARVLVMAPQAHQSDGATVRLLSTTPKVTFYGRTFDPPSELTELCRAPCEVVLPKGPYELSITDGTIDPVRAGRFELQRGGTLLTSFKSRDRLRRAGLGVLSVSAIVGASFSLLASTCDRDADARYCNKEDFFRVSGATLLTAGVISGLVMVLMPDRARVEWLRSL